MAKFKRVILTVEAEIESKFLDPDFTLNADLVGEVMKVKSGYYENLLDGNITAVKEVE